MTVNDVIALFLVATICSVLLYLFVSWLWFGDED